MKGKWKQRRKVSACCHLSPLVSAVASRLNDPLLHWIGHRTLSSLSCLYISLFSWKPKVSQAALNSCWTTHTVLLQPALTAVLFHCRGKQHVVHNNWAPLSTLPMENKGDTLLKALRGALCIIECYIMFTVHSLCSHSGPNKQGWSAGWKHFTPLVRLAKMKDLFLNQSLLTVVEFYKWNVLFPPRLHASFSAHSENVIFTKSHIKTVDAVMFAVLKNINTVLKIQYSITHSNPTS